MSVEIKRLGAGDEVVLERVAEDVFDYAIDLERLSAYLAEPNQHLLVAVKNGEVVGQIRATVHKQPDEADQLYIDNLGVTPVLRRRGVATELLNAILKLGKELGCEEAWLLTEKTNAQARKFYESFGVEAEVIVMYAFDLSQTF